MNKSSTSDRCDQIMVYAFCAMIFFLPIAPALIEWSFGIAFIAYITKHLIVYSDYKKEYSSRSKMGNFINAFTPEKNIISWPLALFVYVAFLSTIFSQDILLSVKGFVFKFLQSVYIYLMFIECMSTKKRFRLFLNMFLISAFLILVDGCFQYIFRFDFIRFHPVRDGRITSTFKHSNDFGGYLVLILPVFLSLFFTFLKLKNSHLIFWKQKILLRTIVVVVLLSGLFCLGVTYSRSAWLAALIAFIVLAVFMNKRKMITWVVLATAIFTVIFIPKMLRERTSNFNHNSIFTTSSRLLYWTEAVHIIKFYPVFGLGLNNYSEIAPDFKMNDSGGGYPHNCYLQLTAEMGIAGGLSFLILIYSFITEARKKLLKSKEVVLKALGFGLLAGVSGYFVHILFETSFYSVYLGNMIWLMMGFIVTLSKFTSGEITYESS